MLQVALRERAGSKVSLCFFFLLLREEVERSHRMRGMISLWYLVILKACARPNEHSFAPPLTST